MKLNTVYNIRRLLRAVRKPMVLWKIVRAYWDLLFRGRIAPRYFDISVGYSCNLSCQHCFNKGQTSGEPVSLDEYGRFARDAMRHGAFMFYFQGGEIFTVPGWDKIIERFSPAQNIIAVTTNGWLLTEDILKRLRSLRVDVVIFSLDSGDPDVHDAFRGRSGSFHKVIEGIELALGMGFTVSVNTVLHHQNVRSSDIEALFDRLGRYRIKVNTLFAAQSGKWSQQPGFLLTAEDVRYYYDVLKGKYPFLNRDVENNLVGEGCPAGKEVFYVDPQGNLFCCPFIHLSLGNIKTETFGEIRRRIDQFGFDSFFKRYSRQCYVAEDREFITRYLNFVRDKSLPCDGEEFFSAGFTPRQAPIKKAS